MGLLTQRGAAPVLRGRTAWVGAGHRVRAAAAAALAWSACRGRAPALGLALIVAGLVSACGGGSEGLAPVASTATAVTPALASAAESAASASASASAASGSASSVTVTPDGAAASAAPAASQTLPALTSDSAASAPVVVAPAPAPAPAPLALEPAIAEPTGTGALVSAERVTTLSAATLRDGLALPDSKTTNAAPRYDVQAWRIRYRTLDGDGRLVEASGLMAVPVKPAGAVSPVLSYQHGTVFKNAEAPSQHVEATEPTLLLASLGYFTIAADYVGYGATQGLPHPYLQSAPTAAAVVDLITAARVWRQRQGVRGNGQLFLLGYSEGGYATMAAHRALQASNSVHLAQLDTAVPGAGPYHLGETMDVLLTRVKNQNRLIGTLLSPGLLSRLGGTVRNEVRRALVRELIPDDADVSFDTRILDLYLADDADGLERLSNVHDWKPAVPVWLFHGRDDQTVPYQASTRTLVSMQARGASAVSLTDCPVKSSGHLDCVPSFFDFLQAQLGSRARDL